MSPHVRVATFTYTRLAALRMHAARFLELAGVDATRAGKVADAIERRQLDAIAVFAVDHSNRRVIEQEFRIDWGQHFQLVATAPTIDASQPGWEDRLAVEVRVACERFRRTADALRLSVRSWVMFTSSIRANPAEYRRMCLELGYGATTPAWKGQYQEQRLSVTGLDEATIIMRVYED